LHVLEFTFRVPKVVFVVVGGDAIDVLVLEKVGEVNTSVVVL
jgi:hypothetical protein